METKLKITEGELTKIWEAIIYRQMSLKADIITLNQMDAAYKWEFIGQRSSQLQSELTEYEKLLIKIQKLIDDNSNTNK